MAEMHQSLNSASRDLIQTLQSVDNNENSTINNAAQVSRHIRIYPVVDWMSYYNSLGIIGTLWSDSNASSYLSVYTMLTVRIKWARKFTFEWAIEITDLFLLEIYVWYLLFGKITHCKYRTSNMATSEEFAILKQGYLHKQVRRGFIRIEHVSIIQWARVDISKYGKFGIFH